MDLVLPPASKASTIPVSFNFCSFSTPKNGSGAKIGASSKSCSLVDDGPDGSGVILLESEPLLPLFEGVFSGLALSSTSRIGSLAYLMIGYPYLAQPWNRPASALMVVKLETLFVQVLPQF